MTNIDKFAKSEMTESQEKKYIESLYDSHYDKKLKEKYTTKLSSEHGVLRDSESVPEGKKKPTIMRTLLLSASSIAAIFVLGFFLLPFLNGSDDMSSQQMATNMLAIEKMDVKRGDQEDSQLKLDIKSAFNNGQYQTAIELYKSSETMTDIDKYWLGRSYLYIKDYTNAKSAFNSINASDSFKFTAELDWYLALNYVFLEDYQAAKPLLEKVAASTWKNKEARELLDSMPK